MSEVQLLAKSIEIDSQAKTIQRLANDLASVTLENKSIKGEYYTKLQEAVQQIDDLSKANVSLSVELSQLKSTDADAKTSDQIREMEDHVQGLVHRFERHSIITEYVYIQVRDEGADFYLPAHQKLRKQDRFITLTDLPAIVKKIDELYKDLDNHQLKTLLRV